MAADTDSDYVLGTHNEEIARLGLQHEVWREYARAAWRHAGVRAGSRVLDVGCGPGFATADLAEVVGPTGEVVAIDRSRRFLDHAAGLCRSRGLSWVRFMEADLATALPSGGGFDAVWCRWVASFVPSPEALADAIAAALRPGGAVVFHEYADYGCWRLLPRRSEMDEFVAEVMASWRAAGGEPDVADRLLARMAAAGLRLTRTTPLAFCPGPTDPAWQWPASFVAVNLARLVGLGRVSQEWADGVRRAVANAEADPGSRWLTPLVLEIIAVKED